MKTSGSEIKCFRESSPSASKSYDREVASYNHFYDSNEWKAVGFKLPTKEKIKSGKHLPNFEPAYQKVKVLNKVYVISSQLQEIINEIIYSEALLELEYDWDCDEGLPVDKQLYSSAIAFLIQYSEYLLNSQKVAIRGPEINLCPNGSLDLSWSTKDARLLINLKKKDDNVIGRFYGFTKSQTNNGVVKIEKEGGVDMTTFDEVLAIWMKCLA